MVRSATSAWNFLAKTHDRLSTVFVRWLSPPSIICWLATTWASHGASASLISDTCSPPAGSNQLIDFSSLVAVSVETGRCEIPRLVDLPPLDTDGRVPDPDFAEIADKDWAVAQERFAAIQPLLGNVWLGRRDVAKRAAEGVDTSTLYRWIDHYR